MSDKVWVVTQGCYSDYRICAIFDKEEDANTYRELISTSRYGGDAEVEEWDMGVEPAMLNRAREGYRIYRCHQETEGECEVSKESPPSNCFIKQGKRWDTDAIYYFGYVWAKSEEGAIKRFQDLLRTMIGTGQKELNYEG